MNYSILRKVKHQKSYDIPAILSTNVRALTNKVDEIQKIVELNSVSAICITETWLSPNVPDFLCRYPWLQSILQGSNYYRRRSVY